MILIGQYDSPFVRRVGIALTLYGMDFEHRPWSVFGDAEAIRALNPLMRVPTLVLEDGLVLTDSHMMLDYLDSLVEEPMFPRAEPLRHVALRRAALATGLADKAVSLFYERRLHSEVSRVWEDRCQTQIGSVLEALERESGDSLFWDGKLGHADIALACALRFALDAHPGQVNLDLAPRLEHRLKGLEALPAFQMISQPFVAPT